MNCNDLKSVYIDRTGDWVRSGNDTGKFYLKEEVDAVIAELKQKIEDAQATAYAESVDAGMRERKLKRVLWIARVKRAEARKNYWYARSVHEGDDRLWSIDGSAVKYIGCIKRTNFDWLKTWSEVEIKCRAMAEKFGG